MSNSKFDVKTHVFSGQHIRFYPGATRGSEDDALYLEAKQYIPLSNPRPREGDVTIIASHAASFPKEMYEPLWDVLLDHGESNGFQIRGIWIADASNHGASAVLNERVQGDDPAAQDNALDILHMINKFRKDMPQPLFGFGHSMGGTALIQLSLVHPRLLAGLVLLDPVIGPIRPLTGIDLIYMNLKRQDIWNSREEAEKYMKSQRMMRTWDPKALDIYLKHGLRDTPTLLCPEPGKVTLTTTKAQEAWTYTRSWFDALQIVGGAAALSMATTRAKYPDMDNNVLQSHPFHRSIDRQIWEDLPRLRPGVLYVFPDLAFAKLSSEVAMEDKVGRTGTGAGGSGGEKEGRVAFVEVKGSGHLLAFEKPAECARLAAKWLGTDLKAWLERREFERKHRDDKSIDQVALSNEWAKRVTEHFMSVRGKGKVKAKL